MERKGLGSSPPRVKKLKELVELSIAGELAHTTSAFRAQGEHPWPEEAGLDTWDAVLSPDLKKAGPEIYTSMKSASVHRVRYWINSTTSDSSPSTWSCLILCPSWVSSARTRGTPAQALSMIGQCDGCEIALRRVASRIHEKRTGDKDAAQWTKPTKGKGKKGTDKGKKSTSDNRFESLRVDGKAASRGARGNAGASKRSFAKRAAKP